MTALLWIDDDVGPTNPMVRLLERRGFTIDCAQSAVTGLSMALRNQYDAIILDLRLPDGSGLGVLDSLRAQGVQSPVALLTAFGTVQTAMAAGQLGASRFLQKPVTWDIFVTTVQDLVQGPSLSDDVVARLLNNLGRFLSVLSRHNIAPREQLRHNLKQITNLDLQNRSSVLLALTRIEAELLDGRRPHEDSLARAVGMERSRLGRHILTHTGLGYRDWRRLLAMGLAVRELGYTDARVSQIAYRLGFEHHSRFDTEFVSTFGMTPSRFRTLSRQSGDDL